ncbi:MAG: sugar ABC transporter substrate-binding protein [Eubacteriales bacterium]|nr:sugar ABC transporter substrate-binding protein [Eubacteriales bacterium]
MKNKNCLLALTCSFALVTGSLLSACGSPAATAEADSETTEAAAAETAGAQESAEEASERTTLTIWMPPLGADTVNIWEPLLKPFEEENNVDVQVELIPWANYEEKWATSFSAGETPDIGYMYAEMYPTYISAGAITDMTDMVTEEDYDEYLFLDRGEMMGGLYGIPIVTGVPFVLYYNQDILDELGETAPETWEDFKRICEKATQDTDGDGVIDQYGYAVGLNSGDMSNLYMLNAYVYSLLWQAGGDIYADDLKSVRFNDEAGVRAIEFFQSLKPYMPENVMSISGSDAFSTIFGAGKAAFGVARSSQSQETLFAKDYPDLNWDYVTSLKDKNYGTFGAADCLSIMSASENKDLAMKLIKYITGAGFMSEYHKQEPGAPLTKSEPYNGDAKMERIITDDRDKWRPLQVGPAGSEILENYASHIQAVMGGDQTVEEALNEAAEFGDETLNEYWQENEG